MVGWRMDYIVYGLLTSSGTRHYNEKSVRWIKLWLNYFFFFFFLQKMANRNDMDNLCITSLLPLYTNYLWGNCKSPKGICCLQLFVYYTFTSVFVNFLQTLLVAFCTFFVVDSPVAYYPAPKIQTLWIDVIV